MLYKYLRNVSLSIIFTLFVFAGSYKVRKVIDGDTFVLFSGETVRLIGVDTPEKGKPYYKEAKEFLKKLIENKSVWLEFDVQKYDKYRRLLAYVWLGDTLVNELLLLEGYAALMTIPPNVKYTERFKKAYKYAFENNKGLWAENSQEEPYYIGSIKSQVFHRPGCKYAKKISPKNRVIYKTREEAIKKGKRPCRVCNP